MIFLRLFVCFLALSRSASSHYVAPVKQAGYDALLKPSGNFQQLNAQRQAKNNAVLIGGSLFGLGSIVAVYVGFIDFVEPPKIPK